MNDAVLPYLRCPVCGGGLAADRGPDGRTRALRCDRGHHHDVARQGYASLAAGRAPHRGDSAAMVADRAAFLAAGHYGFVADAVAAAAAAVTAGGPVLDAGTGTGYYLARVLDDRPAAVGLGLDVSKPALRRAARAHPRAGAVLADLWRPLPVADGCAALVLDVFAPRNGPEYRRVLRPDGALVVVTPAPEHLGELAGTPGVLGVDPAKAGRVAAALGDGFTARDTARHTRTLRLTGAELTVLVGMTPSARHVDPARWSGGDAPVEVTAAVDVAVYRPR